MDNDLQPYFSRRQEVTVHQGCLPWGSRVIISEPLRRRMISMIHEGHMGVVKMKAIARSHILWSGIDADIHEFAKKCCGCMNHRNTPPEAPINSWEFPVKLWQNIHVVFAGPFLVSIFQIVVNAHSKWSEVLMMNRTVAALFVEILRFLFAINGLSEHLH